MKIIHYSVLDFPYHHGLCGGSLKVAQQIYEAAEKLGHTNIKIHAELLRGRTLQQIKEEIGADLLIVHFDHLEHVSDAIRNLKPPFVAFQHCMYKYNYPPEMLQAGVKLLIPSKKLAQELAPEILMPFPHSVDDNLLPYSDRLSQDRSPIVGFISRLEEYKLNVEAILLLKKYPQTKIIGGGALESYLRSEGFNCTGFIPYEKIFEELNTIDIFAYPTKQDSFGCVLLEAQSTGLPVVTFNVGGVPDATCGFVVNNTTEFVEKIDTLYNDKYLRHSMGIAARKFAEQLSTDKLPERLDVVIKSIT